MQESLESDDDEESTDAPHESHIVVAPSIPDRFDFSGLFPGAVAAGFHIESHGHAAAILRGDFTGAVAELDHILSRFRISTESLIRGGGGEHELTQWLRAEFTSAGWPKHEFVIKKL